MFELYFSQHQHEALKTQHPRVLDNTVAVCVCEREKGRDTAKLVSSLLESSVCVSSLERNTSLAHFCLTD